MASIEVQPSEPRTVSKRAFWWMYMALAMILIMVWVLIAAWVSRVLGVRLSPAWTSGLGLPTVIVSRLMVDAFLKRRGLSLSGKTVEVQGRAAERSQEEIGDEVIELRSSAESLEFNAWISLILVLLIGLGLAAFHNFLTGLTLVLGCLLIAIFSILNPYIIYLARHGDLLVVRVDASGISARPVGLNGSIRYVPWSEVATCEIETVFNTFGQPRFVRPTLKRYSGETIMTVNLGLIPIKDQQRLVHYIKARLPKAKYDPWDW